MQKYFMKVKVTTSVENLSRKAKFVRMEKSSREVDCWQGINFNPLKGQKSFLMRLPLNF